MKILYLSCHSILEYDEIKLLTELDTEVDAKLDIEVFSMGAFQNPTQSGDYSRSVIPKGRFYPELYHLAMQCDKDNIHPKLVEWADVILSMHNSAIPGQKEQQRWLEKNWKLFKEKNKKVVWRSIGQSVPQIEQKMAELRKEGLKILRFSPVEERIPNYAGSDGLIRFYKDPEEFNGWKGDKAEVITITQSFKQRGEHLGFHIFERVTAGFNRKVYGNENADLGSLNGGAPGYEDLKNKLREARCFYYSGTQPSPYTLSFIEAMMTGVPIVAVGAKLRDSGAFRWNHYEVPEIISNGINGYVSDSIEELRGYISLLLSDQEKARQIGEAGRQTAIKLFGRVPIMQQWVSFLKGI